MIQIVACKKPVYVQNSTYSFSSFKKLHEQEAIPKKIDPHFYNMASISAESGIEALSSVIGSLPYKLLAKKSSPKLVRVSCVFKDILHTMHLQYSTS